MVFPAERTAAAKRMRRRSRSQSDDKEKKYRQPKKKNRKKKKQQSCFNGIAAAAHWPLDHIPMCVYVRLTCKCPCNEPTTTKCII